MLKKKLTLMLIPSTNGVSRQLSIPVWSIYFSIGLALILLVSSFYFSSVFFTNKVEINELEKLRTENDQLIVKYEQMRWNLAEVKDRFDKLVDKEIKIRHLFDLPEINSEERQLGIGGPKASLIFNYSPAQEAAYLTESEVDRLLKLSKFELENYNKVENSLIEIKIRLNHTPSIKPCKGWYSSKFGMRNDPFTGYRRMHRGVDISGPIGTPIVAPSDGVIKTVTRNNDFGKMIAIDHGYGFKTRYGHLSQINVKRGQQVKRGDVIGLMGTTGYSTGSHLHYEVIRNGKFLNPQDFILN